MKQLLYIVLLSMLGLAQAAEFLPVDEAFELDVRRDGERLLLDWDIAEDYYLYRDRHSLNTFDGGEVGPAELAQDFVIKYDPNFDEDMALYYDRMSAEYPVVVDSGYIEVVYQGCAEAGLCYPPQKRYFDLQGVAMERPAAGAGSVGSSTSDLEGELINFAEPAAPVQSTAPGSNQPGAPAAEVASMSLVAALVFAALGGLVLNLMPCVFPVLSLKALHIAQYGHDQGHARLHGWIYTLGVVLSFMVVAAVLLLLRQLGNWVGWGFQLQSPYFVAFLVFLFYILALAMAGYVEVGQRLMGVGQDLTQKPGASGTFFTGVLATLVATPCTAPFMGSAIGFALLQPAGVGLLIFAVMGLGMALPILLITYLPGLAKRLPKPGHWMTVFRQLMAFPLFATVLWLVWVLVELEGSQALLTVGIGLLLLTVAVWPALNVRPGSGPFVQITKRGLRAAVLVIAVVLVFDHREETELWEPYDAQLVDRYRAQGEPVFLDVTAAWCITCKVNERVALSGDRFEQLVKDEGIRLVKADWTNPSPSVDALIEGFDREGIPLYAFYPADGGPPQMLPQVLTPGLIQDTFTQ
ncbi:protein-disulfide reductase DsbD family protein [Saccharospirillum salsuginis]|uniref:Thiol:disulfide interchange protein DsbD n=1 Tax=Saccharospirillum salsuginis TaxID=418750 RepID=A0A918K892_9GAMM|nr:protein-disulfide reductase DsbD [Saccharospirillum salsuginis]GGX51081.1 hypothetical protein GCM10007392_17900 [Saccharospirillum salsuginis]